jgi:hypothetical protein
VPYAAADLVGLDAAIAGGRAARTGIRRLDEMQGLRGGLARTGANVALNAPVEGLSETFQEGINQLGRMAVNPSQTLFNPEANERYLESFIGGAALGGTVSGAMGGWRRSQGYQAPERETDLTTPITEQTPPAQRPLDSQFVTQDQTLGLQKFINQTTGVDRTKRKDYVAQFKAAYDEPSGQFVNDPETGLERPLTVGESLQRDQAPMDLTQPKPADAAAASATVASTVRDPRSYELRDTFKVIPTPSSLQLYSDIQATGIPADSDLLVDVWKFAGDKPMTPKRLEKAQQLLDAAIIKSRQEAPSVSTAVPSVQQPAGGVGVGGAVVPGVVGNAGSAAPVAGTMVRSPAVAGRALQQTGILPSTTGQPTTPVTTGAPSGTQAPQTVQAAPQGQAPTTAPSAAPAIKPNTTLRLNKQEALPGETDITNLADIARMTGNDGGIDAALEDEAGLRRDQTDFTADDLEAVIEQHLSKSKDKERDRQILNAYLTARRAVPEGYKGNIAKEIAASFGVAESRVRQIGNPELLANTAESMGFDRSQVFDVIGVQSAKKAAATELGKLEGELGRLESKAKPSQADIDRMSELSEQIDRAKGNIQSGDLASALKDMGLEGEAGESFATMDDSRDWQKASTAGSQLAEALVSTANNAKALRDAAAELKALGLTEAADAAEARAVKLDEVYKSLAATVTEKAAPKAAPVSKATATVKEAQQRWKDAGRDITKLSSEDLGLLLPYVRDTIKNTELAGKITAELESRGETNAVQVQSTAVVPVQPKTETGQGVGSKVRRAPKPAAEVKAEAPTQILTQAEQAAQAWDVVAADFPSAPKFADLTKAQQNTFIGFGPDNWTKADVETELTKLARTAAAKAPSTELQTQYDEERFEREMRAAASQTQTAPDDVKTTGLRFVPFQTALDIARRAVAAGVPTNWVQFHSRLDLANEGAVRLVEAIKAEQETTQRTLTNEPVTIDVEARVIEETVAPQVAKLPAPQVTRLENHYNAKRDSAEFLAKVKADVVLYATKGAEAVAGAIRDVIKAIHAGVLSVAMIFNPTAVSQIESFVVIPQETQTTTTQVLAELPAEVQGMSDAGKQAYATLIPALKGKIGDKFITIADKPSGRIFVFKANGDLVLQKKALFGLAKGDLYKGNNDLKQNRVTPAGLFGINVVDAAKGGAAAKTAGEYDFGKVFALDDPDATVTFMHSVWLKESDAAKRAAALKSDSAADSRYSFGCINVDKETFKDMVGKYSGQMDGSKLFVVPDVQSTVNDFITGNVANDRLVREGVQPVTKTTTTPVKSATKTAGVDRTVAAKEEEIPAPKNSTLFSKATGTSDSKNSVEAILKTIVKVFDAVPGDRAYKDFVRVHQTAGDAFKAANKKVPVAQLQNAQAFIDPSDGRVVHMIADNIAKGSELAVLLHEVGVHVGLKKKLGANFKILEGQVKSWKNSPANSLERKVYEAAMARVAAARLEGAVTAETTAEELVAYAAEEAALAGVKVKKAPRSRLEAWVKQLHSIAEQAFKNFFRIDKVPELSVQELVNFSFAAAQEYMHAERTEVGSSPDATEAQIVKYYAGAKGSSEGAFIDGGGPHGLGLEPFYWSPDDKFGSFTGIGTRAFYNRARGGMPAYMAMVLTSAESRAFGEQQNNSQDKVLLTIQATLDSTDNTWSLSVYGPENNGALYIDLYVEGLASATTDNEGNEWTRLEGISRSANMRILSEFRRRLTRLKSGEIPNIDFTRVTGSGASLEDGNYKQYSADELAVRYSKAPTRAQVASAVSKLPKQAQQPVNNSINTIGDWARQGLDRLVFTSDLINRAVDAGIKSAKTFEGLLAKRDTKARSLEREVERIADTYAGIEEKHKGDGPNSVNQFIFESTRTGKWGYDSGSFKADPKMAAQFNALGPKAQAYAKSIFTHGNKMLSDKKKAVIDYATSEYDSRIAAETDPVKKAALTKDKVNDLKKFASLFKIREGIPYAPIKRFGDHVVVAKSKAYMDAVAAKDTKLVSQLEKDPDHYHVSFMETKNEARNLAAQLEDQGFFSGGTVAFKERSVADKELFGNSDSLGAITRLRAMADAKANAGDKGAAQMQRMVSDLYLQALAEGSARKSEMRRRGVSGEIDMLRSFAAQGRADANFVASVEYNPQVQDAIQTMRTEANQGSGDLNRKSEILNEVTRRYESSLDVTPTPTINKITRLSSIYYLATSPAYYMQNLTQPWMMSVPAMAGRHDYAKSSAALFAAYGQLGGVMKSARYDRQFDFSKVPGDVQAAIQELANRGKIDIGLETELGEFKIEGDGAFSKGWNKVDKFLRIAVQKVESINRLSTAMAAYRLELAKTGDKEAAINYADRILTETHGDYSSFNAPRFFNNPIGKVALQFRKFQLIQLTYYAKLLKDSGLDTKEKRAATKALVYSLGHTALLAGAMGLPGYSAIAWAIGALFGDDDDPLDVTAELRKFIGDEDMANLIMRGAPTLAGVDISGKVGAGNALSIMPFSRADLTTKAGVIEAAGTLLGGAPVGMVARVADGLGQMMSGEWYKGMEQVLPKGLGDAAKAYRISTEGMSRRNGDIVLPASEVSAWEALVQSMGIQPAQQSVVMERQQNTLEMNQFYQDRSTKVKAQYIKAIRAGESTAEARDAWNKLQEARVKNGYTRQPLSELLKSPQSQAKREKQVVDGVQFNKANKRFVEEQV